LIFALILCTPIFNRLISYVGKMRNKHVVQYLNISLNLTFLITSTMMLVGESYNPFIYFKF